MSGHMRNRGMTQENSSDALAAAAAIGNALSNNGRTVDRSKIPQYNQSFTSRTASIAGMNRYTMVSNSKSNSRASSMNGNGNRFFRSTSSLSNKGHNNAVDNLNLRRQQMAREDAETTFREFGGHQSSKALNVPNLTSRDNKSRTTSLGSSGGITTTVKKYIPGPRGLVAVEVPVQKGPSRYHISSDSNNAGDRAYSLPTGNHNSSSMYRKKTTKTTIKTTGSRERKPKHGIESKGHHPSKVSPKRHTKSSKQQHNDNVPLIETTMNEETEQELRKDLHGPFEFRPMTISDNDDDSFIESNRTVLEKNENRFNELEQKKEIEKLLNEVHTLEEKISEIEVEKSNEEEREQNLILELRRVKQNEERRMEILKRELSIAKENADLEAEELKLIETKRQAHLRDEEEIKSKIETVVVHQRASSKSEPKKLLLKDMGKVLSNTQDQSQDIKNSESNNLINTEEDPVNLTILDSFNDPVFQINSNNESGGNKDLDSLIGSELSDYNCIEGSALDFRATAKTSVESEIHTNQVGLKLPPDNCLKSHEEGTKEHSAELAGRNCALDQNEKDVDQDGLRLDNDEPETSETPPDILEIDTIRPEKVSAVIRDDNDDENFNNYSDEEEEDEDEEYHDSYDVIVHEPVQMEQRITNVPLLNYPLEYPNEANNDKNNQQNFNNTEINQSGTKKAKYLLDANPYLASTSSDTLNLDSEHLNSKSSTETTRTVPGHSKGSPQPEFKSALKRTLALPSSASSSIYSVDTPSSSNTHIAHTTASNTKMNDRRPPTSNLERQHNQPGLTEIPMMSPRRLEDKRKNLNRLCIRTLRGSCNEASLTYKVSHSSSNSSSSPSCHSTRPSIPVNSGGLASHCASKRYSKVPQTSKTSRESPNRLPLNINESALYPKEPPAKKSSFEKERPMNDNLGFRSMSLREPLVTKSTTTIRAGSLEEEEEKREQKGHFSRKSWSFSLPSPLKAKTNHSSHPSNEIEEITGPMKDCSNQNPSLYTESSMNNKENVSQAGTEGHRFSLFKIRSQTLNENISTGTNALNSTNSETSTALPLGVPVTIIEKNGEIHKLHNDDAAKKNKSHHHGGHNKFGRKLKKIFGRK